MTEVRLDGLTKIYSGHKPAVDAISLTIPSGQFVSLLGPSGCGKTTTLKMLAGFEDVSSGAITFDGQDVVRVPAEDRDIGMVFQNYALFPHMTVFQNLAFGLEMRKIGKAEIKRRVQATLEMVQLDHLADRYPAQLSGGQQQRVAIGRALVIEPRILLLDEPLANLDAKLREEMRVFIRALQKRVGITTVYVTHDQAEAMTMSDLVVVMFDGTIAQAGAPSEIYEQPRSATVAGFVGQVNLIPAVVEAHRPDHVDTPFGEIPLPFPAQPGAKVTLVLRPEAVDLHRADAGQGVPAKVISLQYSGAIVDYVLEFADGTRMDVKTIPRHRVMVGDEVRLSVDPSRFWMLDGEG
ncbi:ABC transporter ATP-binding protein [Pseudooceanicola sp. CBS1P-1]|uniref:Spermidine/putrescine import ATP-binding protein PotA n=1 Tax=Pseudooceanicola albus TaxID=2692189 RepID=A0A6L7FXQ8_9RHOB|nr:MULTISPECIES: ABC transporter ATP-binding protein [Pseudooceanicola]MBT9383967.1 ABC transporter ATP-binding protein [Pseudooceanicola endophyticus]MXN16621.1 polyamine ABC transporter ATP-binding protein [Pseudooceanicola albus]